MGRLDCMYMTAYYSHLVTSIKRAVAKLVPLHSTYVSFDL